MTPLVLLLIAAAPAAEPNAFPPAGAEQSAAKAVRYDTPSSPATTTSPGVKNAERLFDRRLIALELALSAIVVEEPILWRFDRLESEAAALLPIAETESDRAAIRSIGERIVRFERLSGRVRQSSERSWRSPRHTERQNQVAETRVAPEVRRTKTRAARSPHDAEGTLRPVVSKRANAPKYAVVDEKGRIAALVTPTPEVDKRLKGMLGQRVGLDGRRGYLTDLRRDHVVAERVTPLGTLRR